jgi:PAS domain S-box-containing protein
VPFSGTFDTHPIVDRVRRLRQNPIAAYGLAIGLVALAILVRWAVGEYVGARVPFISFYPAIILACLLGGLWAGISAAILSSLAAWYLFLTPAYSWTLEERELVQLLLFIFISGINLTVVALLNALVDRVVAKEENMRVLLESAPSGIVVVDAQGTINLVNASAENLFGYKRSELLGRSVEVLIPDRKVEMHRAERKAFQQDPETRSMGAGRDLAGRRKDGSEFPVEIGLNPLRRHGNSNVLATVIDISERKRLEESQQLIIDELQHRTRNLFAVFQAVANRTVDEGRTAAEIKYVLNGRLRALARAYEMLADAAWEGVSLAKILDRQFAGFSERLKFSGCEIVVRATAAQQFSLIIHELATNALKYGALSDPAGRISIEGRIERRDGDGLFSLLWKETGGPPVSPPARTGFGSVILLDSARQFAQRVTMDYPPEGLTYELHVSLSAIEALKNLATRETDAILSEVSVASG